MTRKANHKEEELKSCLRNQSSFFKGAAIFLPFRNHLLAFL